MYYLLVLYLLYLRGGLEGHKWLRTHKSKA
jgi:hypothetical protein